MGFENEYDEIVKFQKQLRTMMDRLDKQDRRLRTLQRDRKDYDPHYEFAIDTITNTRATLHKCEVNLEVLENDYAIFHTMHLRHQSQDSN